MIILNINIINKEIYVYYKEKKWNKNNNKYKDKEHLYRKLKIYNHNWLIFLLNYKRVMNYLHKN